MKKVKFIKKLDGLHLTPRDKQKFKHLIEKNKLGRKYNFGKTTLVHKVIQTEEANVFDFEIIQYPKNPSKRTYLYGKIKVIFEDSNKPKLEQLVFDF